MQSLGSGMYYTEPDIVRPKRIHYTPRIPILENEDDAEESTGFGLTQSILGGCCIVVLLVASISIPLSISLTNANKQSMTSITSQMSSQGGKTTNGTTVGLVTSLSTNTTMGITPNSTSSTLISTIVVTTANGTTSIISNNTSNTTTATTTSSTTTASATSNATTATTTNSTTTATTTSSTTTTTTTSSTTTANATSNATIATTTSTTSTITTTSSTTTTTTTSSTSTTTSSTTTTTTTSTSTSTMSAPSCTANGRGNLFNITGANPASWTQYQFNYTATSISPTVMFGFQNMNSHSYYLDTVSVVQQRMPSVELLQNPSFDISSTVAVGWIQWCKTACGSGLGTTIVSSTSCYLSTGNCIQDNCFASSGIDFIAQSFPATVGSVYTISFRILSSGSGSSASNRLFVDVL